MTYIPTPRLRVALAPSRRPLLGVLSLSLILSFLVTPPPPASLATSRPEPPLAALTPSLANLPITFVPNVGQAELSVQFQAQALGGMLFFTPDQIVLALPSHTGGSVAQDASSAEGAALLASKIEARAAADRESVVRLRFVGANPAPNIRSADPLPGIVNYALGNDPDRWHTNVPTYAALRYEQLYPGIDLRYDGAGGRLKGTYLVAAGADPLKIRWRYEGVTSVTVDDGGNLIATLPAANGSTPILREEAPIAWQTIDGRQVPVEVRFAVAADNTISFMVGAYDRSEPLVLDPTLDYSTYVGSNGDDEGRSIAVDSNGAVYLIGSTNSISFTDSLLPPVPGQNVNKGGIDAFITKLDPDGKNAIYTTYLGGNNTDIGNGIVVSNPSAVHVIGSTYSSDFPTASPLDAALGGEIDAFVTTLSVSGTISYSSYLGGNQRDFGTGIALDSAQNLYLTGRTESADFPVVNARDVSLGGPADAFITKLAAADKSMVYSTFLGGSSSDMSNAIAVDSSGNMYVTGQTSSTDFPTLGSARPPTFSGGITDAFVTKLAASGTSLGYSIYLGGAEFDEGMGITVDSQGNAYVTGTTQSTNFPTPNGYRRVFQGRSDAFISKINVSGSAMVYSSYLGGTSDDSGQDIVVDNQNAPYVIGSTKSYDFPNEGALQSSRNGDIDAFVTKLRPTGSSVEYSTYFGGTSEDYGLGIASHCIGSTCATYIVGTTTSRDFPTINGSWKPNYNDGMFDAFVAKFGALPTGPRLYVQPPMKFIGANQRFSVDIEVDSADQDIDTVDAYLEFDPDYLQVVDASGNATTEISPTVDLSKVRINYNNVSVLETGADRIGRIDFSATRLVTSTSESRLLPRRFRAATVHFLTKQSTTGVAPTTISFVGSKGARQSDLYFKGVKKNAVQGNSNIRILSGSLVNGKISLEQRGTPPNARWATALYRGDDNGIVVYENWTSNNPQTLGYFRTDTDNNGRFSVFLRDIVGLDTSQYHIQVKGSDTLSNIRRVDLRTTNEIDFGTLCVGDSSGDDMINGADVSYIVPFYPSDDSLPNFPNEGDANKDKRIDREDVVAIKNNFLKTGFISDGISSSGCVAPTMHRLTTVKSTPPASAATAAPDSRIAATERASISLYPDDIKVIAGQIFTVSLNVDLKSNPADTIDVYLNVNPFELELVDKDGNPIGEGAIQGELELDTAALNNSSCEVTYNDAVKGEMFAHANASVTCYKTPFLPDTFTLATFRLKAKPSSNPSRITLATEGASLQDLVRTTNLYKNGVAIDTARTGATVTVLSRVGTVYVPISRW